jgi:hypothetical protein
VSVVARRARDRRTIRNRPRDGRQLAGIERAVAVHEADDVGTRRDQPRGARGSVSASRLRDHARAQSPRDVGGAVPGPVVDDDRVVAGWKAREHERQRGRLVEHGEHEIGHRDERNHGDPGGMPGCRLRFSKLAAAAT